MIEIIKDVLLVMVLFLLAPIFGILLSTLVIMLWVGLPLWGVYEALKETYCV